MIFTHYGLADFRVIREYLPFYANSYLYQIMSIFQFLKIFTRNKPSLENYFTVELPTSDEVKRYKIMRSLWIGLNEKLLKQLPKHAIQECAKKLGIYKQGALIIDHEDEVAVLMDYCVFHFRRNDVNIVSRYLAISPPENDSIEMGMLQSMLKSFYSIFVVLAVCSGKGVIVGDIISDNELFITDIGLSSSAKPKMMFAANLFPFDKFYMTSGAILPIPDSLFQETTDSIIDKFYKDDNELSPNQEAAFAAQVIRAALQAGVIAKMKYRDV